MTTICLVRHGETDWNAEGKLQGRTDIALNKRGILQAEECGKYLKTTEWDVMITSPLKRAKKTAEIINKQINVPIVEMVAFIERSYGDAEGMTLEKRTSTYPDKVYPNQEDRLALEKRVMQGIQEVNRTYPDSDVLLVAHGGVINAILAHVSNREIGSGKTILKNACISNIQFSQEGWHIVEYNQVSHLSNR